MAAARVSSWREAGKGALLRPVPLGRRGARESQPPAEGLSGAPVRRHVLPQPFATVPAIPDQALHGPLRGSHRARAVPRGRAPRDPVPRRQEPAGGRGDGQAHGGRGTARGLRDRGALPRPHRGAQAGAGAAVHHGTRRRSGRARRGDGGGGGLHPGELHPRRHEPRLQGLLSQARPGGRPGRGARGVSAAVLPKRGRDRGQADSEAPLPEPCRRRRGAARGRLYARRRAPGRDPRGIGPARCAAALGQDGGGSMPRRSCAARRTAASTWRRASRR